MKHKLIMIFIFTQFFSWSQEIRVTDVSDTANVVYKDYRDSYFIRNIDDENFNWKIYYDTLHLKLAYTVFYQNDTCEIVNYYRNNFIRRKQLYYDDSLKHIDFYDMKWYDNGQLMYNVTLNHFPSKVINYYKNGIKKLEFSYSDELFNTTSDWKEWHNNGKLKTIGYYKHNQKHGIWKYYKQNEELEKTEEYKNGKLIKTTEEIKE